MPEKSNFKFLAPFFRWGSLSLEAVIVIFLSKYVKKLNSKSYWLYVSIALLSCQDSKGEFF